MSDFLSFGRDWHGGFDDLPQSKVLSDRDLYAAADAQAQSERTGLWQEKKPTPPWSDVASSEEGVRMRPELDRAGVLKAISEFDSAWRSQDEWQGWEENKAHKFAIRHESKLYPVKKIVSLASGVPVSEFFGGHYPGHANRLVEEVGFIVVPLRDSNPDWTRDELILALDLYLRYRPNPPAKDSKEIIDLSSTLRRLGEKLFPRWERSDSFRNENGVYMKLMNFRRLDPQYTVEGKVGLARGAQGEVDVWKEFASEPKHCKEVANAIMEAINDPDVASPISDEEDDQEEAPEGRLLTRKHFSRERSQKLVAIKRKQYLKKHGKLMCEACGFDFKKRYGDRADGVIECHHTKAVSTLIEGHKTHVNDLALVCANCHRIIHRSKPWLTVTEVSELIRSQGP